MVLRPRRRRPPPGSGGSACPIDSYPCPCRSLLRRRCCLHAPSSVFTCIFLRSLCRKRKEKKRKEKKPIGEHEHTPTHPSSLLSSLLSPCLSPPPRCPLHLPSRIRVCLSIPLILLYHPGLSCVRDDAVHEHCSRAQRMEDWTLTGQQRAGTHSRQALRSIQDTGHIRRGNGE